MPSTPAEPGTENTLPKRYWSHTLYRGPENKPVRVLYADTKQRSEEIARQFLGESVLGFDGEWSSWYPKANTPPGKIFSLIQVASEDKIGIFHIARFARAGDPAQDLIAPSLCKIIESPDIIKVGVSINQADFGRLRKFFNLKPQRGFELSNMHNLLMEGEYRGYVALVKQVEFHLGLPLFKGGVRNSNWSAPLNQEQMDYAAADAYAGFMLYHCMDAKRHQLGLEFPSDRAPRAQSFAQTQPCENMEATPTGPPQEQADAGCAPDGGARLFQLLREERAKLSRANNVPPYAIVPDSVLHALARERPQGLAALKQIRGIGPDKVRKFGANWLDIIEQFLADEKENLAEDVPTASEETHITLSAQTVEKLGLKSDRLPLTPLPNPAKRKADALTSPGELATPEQPLLHTGLSFSAAQVSLDDDAQREHPANVATTPSPKRKCLGTLHSQEPKPEPSASCKSATCTAIETSHQENRFIKDDGGHSVLVGPVQISDGQLASSIGHE